MVLFQQLDYGYLQCHKKRHRLDRVVPTVHIVSHEEVVSIRAVSPNTEQLHQIMELTVDISTHRYWALDFLNIGLLS